MIGQSADILHTEPSVNIHSDDSILSIRICDDGDGFTDNGKKDKDTLVFILIESLVDQLNGSYRRINKNGVCCEISFSQEISEK